MNSRLFRVGAWCTARLTEGSYVSGARYVNGCVVEAGAFVVVIFKIYLQLDAQQHTSRLSMVTSRFRRSEGKA